MSATPAPGRLQIGGASLVYQTIDAAGGGSMPFMFQHGLGGDANQPLGYIGNTPPSPVISLNARGHAPSSDIDPAAATFDTFADDEIALDDQLELARFIVGGMSLGAGTALNLAICYPDRVAALVLCRPAWLDRPQAEFNQHAYAEIADLLEDYPPESAAARYIQTRTYQTVRSISPAAAAATAALAALASVAVGRQASLLGQLTRPRAAQNAVILRAFPNSSPTSSMEDWLAVDVPTLVIGHHDDPFHPYEIAEAYADTIPGATLRTVPSKDADPARFAADIQTALHDFLRQL
jgi:pimeloyl-ACP methyl ester carboxylesterase